MRDPLARGPSTTPDDVRAQGRGALPVNEESAGVGPTTGHGDSLGCAASLGELLY